MSETSKEAWTVTCAIGPRNAFTWRGAGKDEQSCADEAARAFRATRRLLQALGRPPAGVLSVSAHMVRNEDQSDLNAMPRWTVGGALLDAYGVTTGKPKRTAGRQIDFAQAMAPIMMASARATGRQHDDLALSVFAGSPVNQGEDGDRDVFVQTACVSMGPGGFANIHPIEPLNVALMCAALAAWLRNPDARKAESLRMTAEPVASATLRAARDARWLRHGVADARRCLDWMRRHGLQEEADDVATAIKSMRAQEGKAK